MNRFHQLQQGITLVEVIITSAIFLTLLGIATINLLNVKQSASLNTTLTTLTADIKDQQLKAMTGDTQGRGTQDRYGIYFTATDYTLFHGSSYNAGDTANFTVKLGDNIRMSQTTFPQSQIIFEKGNGQIVNFLVGSNTVTIRDNSTSTNKTLQFNALGVITQIQ